MNICNECQHEFFEPEVRDYMPSTYWHPEEGTPICPSCGSEDYEDAPVRAGCFIAIRRYKLRRTAA